MKKKTFGIMLGALALTTCGLMVGCGGENPDKEDYSKALNAVSATLTSKTQTSPMALTYPEDDYITAGNDVDRLLIARLTKFMGSIAESQSFELTTEPFSCNVTISGQEALELKVQYSYADGITSAQVIMTDDVEDMTYYQYLNVSIDYNYETETLNKFSTESYYKMTTGVETFAFVEYEGESVNWLNPLKESYKTAKEDGKEKAEAFVNADFTATNFDFSAEYALAMLLG